MPMQSNLAIVRRAKAHGRKTAIIDNRGSYTYDQLLTAAGRVATWLLAERTDLEEAPVAFLIPPSFEYVAVFWGIWMAGGVAVPLCVSHPLPEIEYVVADTDTRTLIHHPDFEPLLAPLDRTRGVDHATIDQVLASAAEAPLPPIDPHRRAMILYTSGTTGKPKGVVSTHNNLDAQVTTLVDAWGWRPSDRILHVLPLHHTHGIVNVLLCPLWTGAICEIMPKFDACEVWRRFIRHPLTLFMAVPTIYVRLIAAWEEGSTVEQQEMSQACHRLRLMVSGSAALPVQVLKRWQEITGHILLERYGMTELGMALSNPLEGDRRAGTVGTNLPGVEMQLVDEAGRIVDTDNTPGEIQIKGPSVFLEYWHNPEATRKTFRDDWFLTGDVAVFDKGYVRILGRSSVDIIKTGGYKVSALEIEEALRTHPAIRECVVVGIADPQWGERVCTAAILKPGAALSLEELRTWAKQRLAPYKVPSRLMAVTQLPRNAMGKVLKPEVKSFFK